MTVINKEVCPCCGQSINKREIVIFASLINAMFKIWKYCDGRGIYIFSRKEAKEFFAGNENITGRFGDLALFGGILYKPKKGLYGFNTIRARAFFTGQLSIPTRALKDPIKKTYEFSDHMYINQIKDLGTFLDENKEYLVRYQGDYNNPNLFQ